MKNVIYILLCIFLLFSCEIRKRKYFNGYTVFHKHTVIGKNEKQAAIKQNVPLYAHADGRIFLLPVFTDTSVLNIKNSNYDYNQTQEITSLASEIPKNQFRNKSNYSKHQIKNQNRSNAEPNPDAWEITGKSKTLAIILCVFLGCLGIHRFYLGYTGMGCLYLATCGLLFFGVIIDLILLVTGNLTPKLNNEDVRNYKDNNQKYQGVPATPNVKIIDATKGILSLELIYNTVTPHQKYGMYLGNIKYGFSMAKNTIDRDIDPYYNQIPPYDSTEVEQLLTERCKALGFSRVRKFSGFRKECHEPTPNKAICGKMKAIIDCQCY
jgi:hypothetical protein